MTDKIIPSGILSIKISCHRTIFFFKCHCNTLSIYQENFSISVFTNVLYHQVNSIGNVICKSYMSLYYLAFFFIPYFPTAILSVYIKRIFFRCLPMNTRIKIFVDKSYHNIPTENFLVVELNAWPFPKIVNLKAS